VGHHGARQLSPLFARRLIRRDRRTGDFVLNLSSDDRAVLRQLVPQFTSLLEDPDEPVVRRLFPPGYSDDESYAEHQQEYRRLMLEDLVARHRKEFDLLASTADAKTLTEDQLLGWAGAINSIRLILGTYLDVSEDDQDRIPETAEESVYRWLTYLLGEAIEALSGQT
jgi:Domain of unknown function (DUF2017)